MPSGKWARRASRRKIFCEPARGFRKPAEPKRRFPGIRCNARDGPERWSVRVWARIARKRRSAHRDWDDGHMQDWLPSSALARFLERFALQLPATSFSQGL